MGFEFGLIDDLDSEIEVYSFIVVVAFILLFEYSLGVMEYLLEGSLVFNRMVQAIYRELMLMGVITFGILLFEASRQNQADLEHTWILAIDFAHILLFFITVFFVMIALFLMKAAISTKYLYRRLNGESLSDLIKTLKEVKTSSIRLFFFNLPNSKLREKIEFKVLSSLFLSTYKLPANFDFPAYLSNCFSRFALKTIERSMFTYLTLMLIIVANFFRVFIGFSCQIPHGDDDHRRLIINKLASTGNDETSGSYYETDDGSACKLENTLAFLFSGGIVVLYTLIILFVTRVYKARLLKTICSVNSEGFLEFLTSKENTENSEKDDYDDCMTAEELIKEIEFEKDANEEMEDEVEFKVIGETLKKIYRLTKDFFNLLYFRVKLVILRIFWPVRVTKNLNTSGILSAETPTSKLRKSLSTNNQFSRPTPLKRQLSTQIKSAETEKLNNSENPTKVPPLRIRLQSTCEVLQKKPVSKSKTQVGFKSNQEIRKATTTEQKNDLVVETEEEGLKNILENYRAVKQMNPQKPKPEPSGFFNCFKSNSVRPDREGKLSFNSDGFDSIYLFGKPIWFFRAYEVCIMVNCLYAAVWITNFATIIDEIDISRTYKTMLHVAMIVPCLITLLCIALIAKTMSVIDAISNLNLDVVYEVLKRSEDMQVLVQELRGKILARLVRFYAETHPDLHKKQLFIHEFFTEIDVDGSGTIDKMEFRLLLRKLNLKYSDKRFRLLFNAVDSSGGGDGLISESELTEFLFPDDSYDKKKQKSQNLVEQNNTVPIVNTPESALKPIDGRNKTLLLPPLVESKNQTN